MFPPRNLDGGILLHVVSALFAYIPSILALFCLPSVVCFTPDSTIICLFRGQRMRQLLQAASICKVVHDFICR